MNRIGMTSTNLNVQYREALQISSHIVSIDLAMAGKNPIRFARILNPKNIAWDLVNPR